MALKVSGAHKGKPVTTDATFKKGQKSYPDFDTNSNGVPYTYISSSSTPAWDFPSAAIALLAPTRDLPLLVVTGPHREMFNKWQAQRWWGRKLRSDHGAIQCAKIQSAKLLNTPGRSEDGRDSTYPRLGSPERALGDPIALTRVDPRYKPTGVNKDFFPPDNLGNQKLWCWLERLSSWRPKGEMSVCGGIEDDDLFKRRGFRFPQLADGTRELRRVRFSREKFGEVHAKLWWETNRDEYKLSTFASKSEAFSMVIMKILFGVKMRIQESEFLSNQTSL
ncbi:protein brevis radix-like 1 [Phtheirospermum japonicum]|uniref:Protein brevis radix-like 1 n=1 Tax=Phtheirospermum japonicum TaxID=374723 RepID=A0A830CUY8_9LAMI|nr:protein brevis radix-like 1 [Phtheirospermum japonicum]